MNLKFWKRKKAVEENDTGAADEAIAATEAGPTTAKPGFLARLKSALSFSRKKNKPEEESEAIPPKPGFLDRLKSALLPSRKKGKAEGEEKPEEPKPTVKHTGKKHRDEEPEPSDTPAEKPRKRLVIILALLIPLAAGGGFFAASKLLPPPQQQKAPPAKNAATQEVKVDGQPAPGPAEAAEQAPKPEPEQPPTEPAQQQADNATPPAAEAPAPAVEAPAAEATAPAEEDVQAQIQALKKQNQEMQAQIEALKKQPAAERAARSSTSATPREGVLIINGKNARESVQGLKKVIEGMNAAPGEKDSSRK